MFGVGRQRDLAAIGGETGAAKHDANIAPPGRRPKRLDTAQRPCNSTLEQTRNIMPGNRASWSRGPNGAFRSASTSLFRRKVWADSTLE
jgi:hypothetical protein